ncbi:LytR/AlgR family response regulator transcription factor [Candidatus Enterococcus clewellii]|uniref:Two-component system, LytTR family, response regulator AgrA n=1 Tax=Candidatus Enterococcus clewellii TaxID=1834193 RepID=A0A242JZC1_9ENTE|nr:LytTR family DNA-binding domain-containing protein [Enterococcus sp. 9E7_DIV0242]OTP10584.1 hypothetical protein A5888_003882 [Enterococcus sp. 9E7_DIV0242]
MLTVFICEDDPIQRLLYKDIIERHIIMEELNMKLTVTTDNPLDILQYLDKNAFNTGIYFLDIDLNHSLSGLELAMEIRKRDSLGKIIFVTTHDEFAPLTYRYKIEALDFIEKTNIEDTAFRLKECLTFISERQSLNSDQKKQVIIKRGKQTQFINFSDILFFETTGKAHRLYVHTKTGKIEFYGKIKEMENHGDIFIRVHKSYVVNLENIKKIDNERYELEMVNGQRCAIAPKKIKLLKR